MAATQDATFYSYVNMGFAPTAASQDATVETYENIGFQTVPFAKDGTVIAYENMGIIIGPLSSDGTSIAYENMGVAPPQQTVVIRQPRGWGIIPTGSQTVSFPVKSADATAEAYEDIT